MVILDRDKPRLGIGLAILATLLFACLNSMTKHVSAIYPVIMILWFRYLLFSCYGISAGLQAEGRRIFHSNAPILQIIRALLLVGEVGVYIVAFRHLPLAEISAISAVGPIVTMVMSAVILRETVSTKQWVAAIFGFIGVVVIVKPGFASFDPLFLIPMFGTLVWGLYQVLTRLANRRDSSQTTTFFTGFVGFVVICFIVPFYWQPVDLIWSTKLLILAFFGVAGHTVLIKALNIAPASLLQPFSYFGMVWAVLFGWSFFNEIPQATTILGAIIVVTSGIYIFKSEKPNGKGLDRLKGPKV